MTTLSEWREQHPRPSGMPHHEYAESTRADWAEDQMSQIWDRPTNLYETRVAVEILTAVVRALVNRD